MARRSSQGVAPFPLEDRDTTQKDIQSSPKLDEATSNDDQTHVDECSDDHCSKVLEEPSQTSSPIRVKDEAI